MKTYCKIHLGYYNSDEYLRGSSFRHPYSIHHTFLRKQESVRHKPKPVNRQRQDIACQSGHRRSPHTNVATSLSTKDLSAVSTDGDLLPTKRLTGRRLHQDARYLQYLRPIHK